MSAAADTARLLASLDLQDQMSPKLKGAIGTVGMAESKVGSLGTRLNTLGSNLSGGVSNAVGTFRGRISQLGGALTGLLGIGGALGVGAILGKSIEEAANFGKNVQLVAGATNLAIPVASAMVDTLDKWGIASDRLIPMLGKMEKNVGAIAAKKDGLAAFGKTFGVTLTDSNGKIADANTLLLRSADYFNSNATATQKATFLSKLWGKNWQDMIPILSKGSAFIKAQEADSIHLTQQQLDNITNFRNAQREFQDSLGDTEVKIGSVIMPLITTALTTVTHWLDAHQDDVAQWFQNAAGAVGHIVSTAIDVVGAIQSGWNAIPEPLRNLILTGLIADRTVKFLFGFSPAGLVVKLAGDVIGGIGSAVAKGVASQLITNKIVPQHVWVDNPGFGGAGGGAANVAEDAAAASGAGAAAGIATIATGIASILAAYWIPYLLSDHQPGTPLNLPGGQVNPNSNTGKLILMGNPNIGNIAANNGLLGPSRSPGSAVVNVVDDSPGAREEREVAKKSATWNAATAAHSEALNAMLSTKTQEQISRTEKSNALLAQIEAKREENRISLLSPITIILPSSGSQAGTTVNRVVARSGGLVAK